MGAGQKQLVSLLKSRSLPRVSDIEGEIRRMGESAETGECDGMGA